MISALIPNLTRAALLACGTLLVLAAAPQPASAMCGGNPFLTCPPQQQKPNRSAERRKKEQEQRAARRCRRHSHGAAKQACGPAR